MNESVLTRARRSAKKHPLLPCSHALASSQGHPCLGRYSTFSVYIYITEMYITDNIYNLGEEEEEYGKNPKMCSFFFVCTTLGFQIK